MGNVYPFRRYFYYDVIHYAFKCIGVFISGPRKCGKTVCLKQIQEDYPYAIYFSAKNKTKEEIDKFMDKAIASIHNNERVLYL